MVDVYRSAEIYLGNSAGGHYFPIAGRVMRDTAEGTPGKLTIGRSERADQTHRSEWVMADFTGGILVEQMDETSQADRLWWAFANIMHPKVATLPPLATNIGSPAGTDADCDHLVPFAGFIFASFGGKVFYWSHATGTWSGQLVDAGSAVSDSLIFLGDLYLAYGTGYVKITPALAVTNTAASPTLFLTEFDASPLQKLIRIDATGLISTSLDGTTWSTDMGGQIPDSIITGMRTFVNAEEAPMIVVATTRALWTVNVFTKTVYKSSLQDLFPQDENGSGLRVWGPDLYFPEQLGLWRYPSRGGSIVNIGMNREDGLPQGYRGRIVNLSGFPETLIAAVDVSSVLELTEESMFLGAEWGSTILALGGANSYSGLYAWTGSAWSCQYLADSTALVLSALAADTAAGERRLYFGVGTEVLWVRMGDPNIDPLNDPLARFGPFGQIITPWFDDNRPELRKLATSQKMRGRNMTATEFIEVYRGVNDESGWELLGVLNQDRDVFTFREGFGEGFNSIRFRFDLYRGEDTTKSPGLVFFDLRHKMRNRPISAFRVEVVAVDGVDIWDLHETLHGYKNGEELLEFCYRAKGMNEKKVEITGISEIAFSGMDMPAKFTLTLVESDDAEEEDLAEDA